MIYVKGESAWSFVTSSTGGAGLGFVAGQGGKLYLRDPKGNDVTLGMGALGIGASEGIKLPKIGKLEIRGKSVGGAVAPASFPNAGKIYVLGSAPGKELTRDDLTGPCVFVEASAGMGVGASASAMYLGVHPVELFWGSASPLPKDNICDTARACLLVAGLNVGIQAGAGIAAFFGAVY